MTDREILTRLYYDGYTVADAREYAERVYGCEITERKIKNAIKKIKEHTGKDWE